jgi:hypothetical protein
MTIFGLSAAILAYWRPFCFFGNHPNHPFILLIGSVTCLCHVLSRLGLLAQFRRQNITRMTIFCLSAAILYSGGHFVSLEIIEIIILS